MADTNLGNAQPNPDIGVVTQPLSRVSTGVVQNENNNPEAAAGLSPTARRSESYESILSIIARLFRARKISLNPDDFEVFLRRDPNGTIMANVYRIIAGDPATTFQGVFGFSTSSVSVTGTLMAVVELDAAYSDPSHVAQLTISDWFERLRREMEAGSQNKVKICYMAQTSPDAARILSNARLLGVAAVADPYYCLRRLLAHLMVFGKHAPHLYSGVTEPYGTVRVERMLVLDLDLPSAGRNTIAVDPWDSVILSWPVSLPKYGAIKLHISRMYRMEPYFERVWFHNRAIPDESFSITVVFGTSRTLDFFRKGLRKQ